jgi:hypothetical protein
MEEMQNAYKILVTKSEGKRSDKIPRHRWDDNIRMYFKEVRWEVVDWIQWAQDIWII